MKKFILLLFVIPLFINCSKLSELTSKNSDKTNTVRTETMPGENTYGVIAGVLKWTDPGFSSFSGRNRKDKELYELLIKNGAKKENLKILLDDEATLEEMKKKISAAIQKAPEGSDFIFYYAGHGSKENDNSIYFANYDITSEGITSTGFNISWLGNEIKKSFKGKTVWLLADCCYSGGLIDEGKKIYGAGINVVVMTSAASCNISTGNWTFTQTIIDCLNGLPLGDANSDGKITLGEVHSELTAAMKYRERQMCGFSLYGIDENEFFSSSVTGSSPGGELGKYYMASNGKDMVPVRVIGEKSGKLECEFFDYSDKSTAIFSKTELLPIHFVNYSKDDKIKVSWEGKWYDAEIKNIQDDFYYIKYSGYEEFWNEWVAYERIKTGKERSVQVESKGAWYPAEVLEESGDRYFIRYKDYGYVWDEWVGKDRIRF
jgi:hypothetical protein